MKTKKTQLSTPTVNAPSDITAVAVRINWNAVSNASGYEVHYSKTNGFAIGGTGVYKRTVNGGSTTNSRFTGLDASTAYYFKVVAKGSGGYSDSAASAQKTATTIAKTKLATPSGLLIPTVGPSGVIIRWEAVRNASSYRVYYSKTSGFDIEDSEVSSANSNTTTLAIRGLTKNTTYYFRVVAIGSGSYSDSDASAQKARTTTNSRQKTQLSTPTLYTPGSTAGSRAAITGNSITLSWDRVSNASGYDVHYSKTSGFTLGAAEVTKVTVNSGGTTSQRVTGLDASTAYYFRVVAVGRGDYFDSEPSVQRTATTTRGKLSTPTVSTPSAGDVTDTSILLSWAAVTNASGYEVHYSKTSGFTLGAVGVTKVTVNNGGTTSQRITGLTRNTSFYFKVLATGSGAYIDSDASAQQTVKTKKTKLSTPTVSTPSGGAIGDTSVSLSWNRVTNAAGYEVHYSTTSGFTLGAVGVTKVTVNSGSTTTQRVASLTANTTYYFKVVATGSGSYSDSDASAQQTVKTNKTKLSTPTVGTPSGNAIRDTSISLSWNRVTNASGYEIHYSKTSGFTIGGGGVTKVTVNSGSTTTQRVASLTANTSYYFKVLAKGGGAYIDSDASTQQTVKTKKTQLSTPTVNTPSSGDITDTSVLLSWNRVSNAAGYRLYYSTRSGFGIPQGLLVGVFTAATTSDRVTGLTANTTYYFKLVAAGSGSYIDSDASAQQSVKTNKTKLSTPTVSTPSGSGDITDTSISLSWNSRNERIWL